MEITFLGFLVIPLGFVFFFLRLRYLFWATVVAAPFFGTAIVQLPELTTMIRPSYFFGGLFCVRFFFESVVRKRRAPRTSGTLSGVLFLGAVLVSATMPFFLGDDIYVIPTEGSVGMLKHIEYEPLKFHRSSFTQILYPTFWIAFFLALSGYMRRREQDLDKVIRLFAYLSLPILVSGIAFVFLVATGNISIVDQFYWALSGQDNFGRYSYGIGGLPLMYSLAGEPGYTGLYFILVLGPILTDLVHRTNPLFGSRSLTLFFFFVVVLGILIGGGTTGYAGLLLIFPIAYYLLSVRKRRFRPLSPAQLKIVVLIVAVAAASTFAYEWSTEESFALYLWDVHVEKTQGLSGSGSVRLAIMTHNFETFLAAPLFGVGYGNDRGLAVSLFLLANVGIVGTFLFYALVLGVCARTWKQLARSTASDDKDILILGTLISLLTVFILMQFAKSESSLLFLYFWILLATLNAYRPSLPVSSRGRSASLV